MAHLNCNRRDFLRQAGGLAAAMMLGASPQTLFSQEGQPERKRKNVLFILVDDLRPTFGAWGDKVAITPNIDKLSRISRNFKRTYIQQPVCGPSRASMLTGLLPDNTHVWHNRNLFRDHVPDTVTLPQHFRRHGGYFAQAMGKVFSGNNRPAEWDMISWSVETYLQKPGWEMYARPENRNGKGTATECFDVADDAYRDGKLADEAVKTLNQYKTDKTNPFFLAVGFYKPHLPFNAPKKYWDLYKPDDFLPIPFPQRVEEAPDLAYHEHRELGGYSDMPKNEKVSPEQARHLRHGYYACVSYVDALIGKVLDTLKKNSQDKDTIVLLWGDHGYSLGEQARWCKGTLFEMDNRIPLMIHVPGMSDPGVSTDSLVEAVDIYPTLAELAGLPAPEGLDGTSFAHLMSDPKGPGRDVALSQFGRPFTPEDPEHMGYSIRTTDGYRFNRWLKWKTKTILHEELYYFGQKQYDEVRDYTMLIEMKNLIDHPDYAEKRDQLSKRMDQLFSERLKIKATRL